MIADELFGADWADARHYRFGASSLLASLLKALGHGSSALRTPPAGLKPTVFSTPISRMTSIMMRALSGWADARHYRFGASSLLASLLKALGHGDGKSASSY
jgi:deoxyribose-phosphate aldolase